MGFTTRRRIIRINCKIFTSCIACYRFCGEKFHFVRSNSGIMVIQIGDIIRLHKKCIVNFFLSICDPSIQDTFHLLSNLLYCISLLSCTGNWSFRPSSKLNTWINFPNTRVIHNSVKKASINVIFLNEHRSNFLVINPFKGNFQTRITTRLRHNIHGERLCREGDGAVC